MLNVDRMELKDIDLNLLVVFNQLLIEGRVSKVADNLGETVPPTEAELAALRALQTTRPGV